jgi:polysaccharide export outer membrane protein
MLGTAKRCITVCALLLAPFVASCSGGPQSGEVRPPNSVAQDLSGYRLGSGDHVRVTVYGEDNLSGEFAVDGRGALSLPLIGKVDAVGLNVAQLEQKIANKLSPQYVKDPKVAVEVITYRPFYIVGEVRNPGSYPYVNGMSVINAVALAGGFTYRAQESGFDINRTIHGDKKEIYASKTTEVLPGDVITVRERYF